MLAEHVDELFGVAARDDVVARREVESGRGGQMSFDTSCSGRPSVLAETRTSRTRSRRRIDDGPLPGSTSATSLSGLRILSPWSSSLSVGTDRSSRSSENRRWSGRSLTRTLWLSPTLVLDRRGDLSDDAGLQRRGDRRRPECRGRSRAGGSLRSAARASISRGSTRCRRPRESGASRPRIPSKADRDSSISGPAR